MILLEAWSSAIRAAFPLNKALQIQDVASTEATGDSLMHSI